MSYRPLKIGLVWPGPNRLTEITVRYERYVRGFERLGHRVVTICPAETAVGYEPAVHTVADAAALRSPGLWQELGLDVAVVIAWLRMPELMAAIKAACPHVVSVGESDGVVGVRVQPFTILRRMIAFHPRWRQKLGAAKHWVLLAAGGYRALERPVLESASAADLITMTSPGARANLAAVFAYHGRPELAGKAVVVPYPVDDPFLTGDVPPSADRPERVVAIGRWDDPQKDAPLLADGIAWAAARLPEVEFVIVGRNGGGVFDRLCRRNPRVRYLGIQPPEVIARLLRESRALVLSSRWESGPIVAFEALASGTSVVGPLWVPACAWCCGEGPYGTLFRRRSGAALGEALLQELIAWRDGVREPAKTAELWRGRFDPTAVCRAMLPASQEEDACCVR
jgi:glycosyltransferase involved in cell wall biosynthesis